MTPRRISGHLVGAAAATGVWETAVVLAPGSPTWRMVAAGVLPPMVAVVSLLIQSAADAYQGGDPDVRVPHNARAAWLAELAEQQRMEVAR